MNGEHEHKSMNAYYSLACDIIMVVLQFLSVCGNGFIIFCFFNFKALRTNTSLWLILVLSLTDLSFALSTIPYVCNFLLGWTDAAEFNYNRQLVILLSLPLTIHSKVNLCLGTAIAIDRLQAMSWPLYYRYKSQCLYICCTLAFAISWSSVDVYWELTSAPKNDTTGCAAVSCFTSKDYKKYQGISNMVLGMFMLTVSIAVLFMFNKYRKQIALKRNSLMSFRAQNSNQILTHTNNGNSHKIQGNHQAQHPSNLKQILTQGNSGNSREDRRKYQTNVISIAIMGIKIVFQLIPTMATFLFGVLKVDKSLAYNIGPINTIGLLAAGALNSLVYILFFTEFSNIAKQIVYGKFHRDHNGSLKLPSSVAPVTVAVISHPKS